VTSANCRVRRLFGDGDRVWVHNYVCFCVSVRGFRPNYIQLHRDEVRHVQAVLRCSEALCDKSQRNWILAAVNADPGQCVSSDKLLTLASDVGLALYEYSDVCLELGASTGSLFVCSYF